MSESPIIQKAREVFTLGMLQLSAGSNEAEIMRAAEMGQQAPRGWTLPAMAVAIAAARSIAALTERVEALEAKLSGIDNVNFGSFDNAVANLTAPAEPGPNYQPDPEELERDFKERLRDARALADKGAGWDKVCEFAFAATARTAPTALKTNQRAPSCSACPFGRKGTPNGNTGHSLLPPLWT